ncbi:MAG: TonB-dependent receptor [Chitinophagaceae bacterium]
MKTWLFISIALLSCASRGLAQFNFTCIVKDSITEELLQGVSVTGTAGKGSSTDANGKLLVKNIAAGRHSFVFTHVGYKQQKLELVFPLINADSVFVLLLLPGEKEMEDVVVVASSRTNSRVENLATKVEVIGTEEMQEENGIKPGNIASILGDIAGIQLQQTSATTGNADMRIQGLQGKYTQILRDGLPLFGGYSGSFGILQIAPLDLKQVEIVKGASSTLYGGGAIAGMINLISKTPKMGLPERSITLNQSTLKESNLNLFLSKRTGKYGYTFFGGSNYQYAVDVNKDGFSDVPDLKSFFLHPRFFFYPTDKDNITVGLTSNYEHRSGGDMQVLHDTKDNQHQFYIGNKSFRNTVDAEWEHAMRHNDKLLIKGTSSLFNRTVETNTFGLKAKQLSWYTETDYIKKTAVHDIVAGINITGEDFHKQQPDSTRISNYIFNTSGFFLQDDWKLSAKFTMQSGLRYDHHNQYGSFLLPRVSLLYKINKVFTTRVGGGLGYKIPSVFSSEIDERDYPLLQPLVNVKAEKSTGANWDVNFKKELGDWELTLNQSFFITQINDPVVAVSSATAINFVNAADPLRTSGYESYVQAHHQALEIYLGYVHTVAKKLYDPSQPYLSLSAKNKFASVVAYEFSSHFRAGIEASATGKQYLDDGSTTPSYLFVAAMMRCNIGKIAFVLNCENLLDYRQTRQESIVIPPYNNPRFKQLWAPIDGRVINLSMMIKW